MQSWMEVRRGGRCRFGRCQAGGAGRTTDQTVRLERPDGKEDVVIELSSGRRLVYRSHAVARVVNTTERCAGNRLPVLVRGETGTGKELIAELIHERSEEPGPIIPVNCAAIPAALWESVVFGHERGAFTDAKERRTGLVADASGGALFFDEIGEMPIEVQPKILRLIQEKQYSRVGSTRVLPVECRLLFSTHSDLEGMISHGEFREDLYYRINVLTIEMPPLRERKSDIPSLIRHFIEKHGKDLNREVKHIDASSLEFLSRYAWPGNVRELENTILRIMTHSTSDRITVGDLPSQITHETKRSNRADRHLSNAFEINNGKLDFEQMVKEYSRDLIMYALQKHRGNKTKTALALGISRGKLKYQIKQLEIE
jgi:transcriptional regulator with PAS, ATPase and Fis domain